MGFGEVWVHFQSLSGCCDGTGENGLRVHQFKRAQHVVAIRKAGPCRGMQAVFVDRLLKTLDCLPERLGRSLVPQVSAPEVVLSVPCRVGLS
jgi:hypothetical protein